MGKKDTVTKAYMSRADVFADAFNQYVYKGRQVIAPESLAEMDTAQIALPYGKDGVGLPQQKARDVQKLLMSMTDAQIDLFQTNLREITRYIKYSKDKVRLNDMLMKDTRFQSVDREATELINVVTGSKIRYSDGEEKINMCLALEQIKEDSKLAGRQEGKQEGEIIGSIKAYQKISMSKSAVAQYIAETFNKTDAEAQQLIEQYWN